MFFGICYSENIHILYTANINATLENCNCGKNPLGGLDRIKTFSDQFKKKNPSSIHVDGGNYFNSYKFPRLNEFTLKTLPLLNYDLLAPGIHIFFENQKFFEKYLSLFYQKVIISNSELKTKKSISFTINNYKLIFFSYISTNTFLHNKKPEWLSLTDKIAIPEKKKNEIFVLLYHGYRKGVEQFIEKNNNFDLVLLSYDQQEGIWNQGKSTIIGGGNDAESIAIIEVNAKKDSKMFNVSYEKMDSAIDSDKLILELIKEFKKNTSQNNDRGV